MQRLLSTFCIYLAMVLPAFCQSVSRYQLGTITEVKVHQTADSNASDTTLYDVSVKVGDTIYVVLYTPPLGEPTVRYVAGRDLLVLVEKSTIRYNDLLGRSYAMPIESKRAAATSSASKSVSHEAQ